MPSFMCIQSSRALSCLTNAPMSSKLVTSCELLGVSRHAPLLVLQQKRDSTSKHWLLKWRPLRRKKIIPIELPDIQKLKKESEMTPDEMRIWLKKEGKLPPRGFEERPINLACTGGIFDAYVSPEGDGRSSFLSKQAPKQALDEAQSKRKTFSALRKMKRYEEDFNQKSFAFDAQQIYIESQNLLTDCLSNADQLHDLVTENAYPLMVHGLDKKTLRWQFIESIEPPQVVHVRVTDMMNKENLYSQVTVRMHTKQTLAIYDRFGRLMYGSEHLVKDVVEYVVFEKHISDMYGRWRVHGKIIPPWMPSRESIKRTYRQPQLEPITDKSIDVATDETAVHDSKVTTGELATA